jgi:redox-sensitive bicupin YhaK (pirin superfamily)
MITIRKSDARGYADHGWLKSHHSFSFADYYDPKHMGFRALRVINEDQIAGGGGFPMHSHRDMEIITYLADGALEHKDSHGNSSVIRPGEVQRMSAGTGVSHSEFNHYPDRAAHLFQIWILPNKTGSNFSYAQKSFEKELQSEKAVLVVSQDGRDGSISIQQDADLYISRLAKDASWTFSLPKSRHAWVQVTKGKIQLAGKNLEQGDAAAISEEESLRFQASSDSEIMLFSLA